MTSTKTRTRTIATALAAAFLLGGSAAPVMAAQDIPHIHRTCKRLDKQIAHFRGVADVAEGRRDYMWWDATRAHIKRLESRRPRICPEQVAEERSRWFRRGAEAARDAVKLAGSMAIRYFAGGGWPF